MLVTSIFSFSHNIIVGKGENAGYYVLGRVENIMFSTLPNTYFNFSVTIILSSANTLNLD